MCTLTQHCVFLCFLSPHTQTQASSIENKQDWIKHIREVIQERTVHLKGALKEPIHIPKPSTAKHKGRRYTPRPVKLLYSSFASFYCCWICSFLNFRTWSPRLGVNFLCVFMCAGMERIWTVRVTAAVSQTLFHWPPGPHRTHWTVTR